MTSGIVVGELGPAPERERGCGKADKDAVYHCWSCGRGFIRGVAGNWFCHERCREWFDEGGPAYTDQQNWTKAAFTNAMGKLWKVVAGSPDVPNDTVYYNDNGGIEGTFLDKRKNNRMIKYKITTSKDRLIDIANSLDVSSRRVANGKIKGRLGSIYANDPSPYWTVKLTGHSPRHWSGIKNRLAFMDLIVDDDYGGELALDRAPTELEAEIIRKIVGLNRKPKLTDEHRASLPFRLKLEPARAEG